MASRQLGRCPHFIVKQPSNHPIMNGSRSKTTRLYFNLSRSIFEWNRVLAEIDTYSTDACSLFYFVRKTIRLNYLLLKWKEKNSFLMIKIYSVRIILPYSWNSKHNYISVEKYIIVFPCCFPLNTLQSNQTWVES